MGIAIEAGLGLPAGQRRPERHRQPDAGAFGDRSAVIEAIDRARRRGLRAIQHELADASPAGHESVR